MSKLSKMPNIGLNGRNSYSSLMRSSLVALNKSARHSMRYGVMVVFGRKSETAIGDTCISPKKVSNYECSEHCTKTDDEQFGSNLKAKTRNAC